MVKSSNSDCRSSVSAISDLCGEPQAFAVETLVQASHEYSGAEIEGAIVAALYDAFHGGRDVTSEDIAHNLEAMVPLSKTMHEEISRLRDWADARARPAS